jgi:hypothetical protein
MMGWIRKSPFGRDEDPAKQMLTLLARESEKAGAPFSDEEKQILGSGISSIPWELDAKARNLIDQILEKERTAKPEERDPKGFGSCLEWSDGAGPSNLVELTYQVASARRALNPPPIKWGLWFKDKIGLVGCGLAVVIFLMLYAWTISFVFDHK